MESGIYSLSLKSYVKTTLFSVSNKENEVRKNIKAVGKVN